MHSEAQDAESTQRTQPTHSPSLHTTPRYALHSAILTSKQHLVVICSENFTRPVLSSEVLGPKEWRNPDCQLSFLVILGTWSFGHRYPTDSVTIRLFIELHYLKMRRNQGTVALWDFGAWLINIVSLRKWHLMLRNLHLKWKYKDCFLNFCLEKIRIPGKMERLEQQVRIVITAIFRH